MIPEALVTITIERLSGLDAGVLAGADRPYAVAKIGGRFFGRSRLIPKSGGTFDLSKEPSSWTHEVAADGRDIPISVEIWDDKGDPAPAKLWDIADVVLFPYRDGPLTIGFGPEAVLTIHRDVVPNPAPTAAVPRVPKGLSTRATLRPATDLIVELTDILGLYAPIATGKPGVIRAERRPGYTSEDHLGRVYVNHDLSKGWKSNVQQLQLEVRVTGPVPPDAKLHWTVLDVDDPSNDATGVHRQWGPYLDAKDYDASGIPKGATGDDNEGKPQHDPPWAEVAGFSLSKKATTEAETAIVGNKSKVVLHCPSTAGDNFIVTAQVTTSKPITTFGTRTGVITMWHRIQVELIRMKSAFKMATEMVPVPFEMANVEMEFIPEREVPDKPTMASSTRTLDDDSAAYVDKVFLHKKDPGWFCVIAAIEPHPLPKIKGKVILHSQKVKLHSSGTGRDHYEGFSFPGDHPHPSYAQLTYGTHQVGFGLWGTRVLKTPAGPITHCYVDEHDVHPDFTAGDGSETHAYLVTYNYSPRFRKNGDHVTPGGYNMPQEVTATVYDPGASYVDGVSPPPKAKKKYFAGRTIVFTHHVNYVDTATGGPNADFLAGTLMTMVHELGHAFGMPHKCGYYNFRTPRSRTCCMNYDNMWMSDDKHELIPDSADRIGINMCGRHLKEIRRVRLQDNKGLLWK